MQEPPAEKSLRTICITVLVAVEGLCNIPDPIGAKATPVSHRIVNVNNAVRRRALVLPEHEG